MAISFITDRTQADIATGTAKGYYNYTDLNRVENAVKDIARLLNEVGITVNLQSIKTDWKPVNEIQRFNADEWCTLEQSQRYMANVKAINSVFSAMAIRLPSDLNNLTIDKANAIEQALLNTYTMANNIKKAWQYCGTAISGGYLK